MKISEMQQKIQNLEKKICFLGDGIWIGCGKVLLLPRE